MIRKVSTSGIATAVWICLALMTMLAIADGFDWGWNIPSLIRALGLALIVLLFAFIYQLTSAACVPSGSPPPVAMHGGQQGEAFPSPSTNLSFVWLVLFVVVSVAGVLLAANPPSTGILSGVFSKLASGSRNHEINEALVTMFGAGVGSAITTIRAFLRHASTQKDFDRAQLPWYVARPMMGMLLGLVFYFLIRGGLLLTVNTASQSIEELNVWSLAGIGALVGLFSKNAIDKLREIFHIIFQTEGDLHARLRGASAQARAKLMELLPDSVKSLMVLGSGEELENALRSLPEDLKTKLRAQLPESMIAVLAPYLGANLLQQIRALPTQSQTSLVNALPESAQAALLQGNNAKLEEALASLTPEQKSVISTSTPTDLQAVLKPYLEGQEEPTEQEPPPPPDQQVPDPATPEAPSGRS